MALLFPFQPRISFRSIERLENIYILLTDILQRKKRIPYKGLPILTPTDDPAQLCDACRCRVTFQNIMPSIDAVDYDAVHLWECLKCF